MKKKHQFLKLTKFMMNLKWWLNLILRQKKCKRSLMPRL
uniref:Uncharacterized protein MANES_12G047900 n=1 Tax=Rhizophora mucronata TaxID=61149 RepID=A0A2P2J916_RHIMU